MKAILLKNVKNGDFFTLRPLEEAKESLVYVRSDYDRETKKYEIYRFTNICDCRLMRGDRIVYVDFIF